MKECVLIVILLFIFQVKEAYSQAPVYSTNEELATISPGNTFQDIVTSDIVLPAGKWTVLVIGTATHENTQFRLGIEGTFDKNAWGSGTGNDWDVQTQQAVFQFEAGRHTVRLQARCVAPCRVLNRQVIALAWPSP